MAIRINTEWNHKTLLFPNRDQTIEYLFLPNEDKDVLVFIHDMGLNQRYFWPHLAYFFPHFQILTYSLRGHGRSPKTRPLTHYTYSVESHTWDLAGLLDHLSINRFHMVGHGVGGVIGLEFLALVPERVQSAVLLGSNAHIQVPPWIARLSTGLYTAAAGVGGKRFAEQYFRKKTRYPDVYQYLEKEIHLADLDVMSMMYAAQCDYSYLDVLKKTETPLLYLVGEEDDQGTRLHSTMQALLDNANPQVQYGTLEDTGTYCNLEKQEEFQMLVRNFFNEAKERELYA